MIIWILKIDLSSTIDGLCNTLLTFPGGKPGSE